MSPTGRHSPWPRPAPSLGDVCSQSWLCRGAAPARTEAEAGSRHREPEKGSPSGLLGTGSPGPGQANCPGQRLRGTTAAGAGPVSMATAFSARTPAAGLPRGACSAQSFCARNGGRAGALWGSAAVAEPAGGRPPAGVWGTRAARRRARLRGLRRGR